MVATNKKPVKGFVQSDSGEFVARTPHGQAEGDVETIPRRDRLVHGAPDGRDVEKSFHSTSSGTGVDGNPTISHHPVPHNG
jgi:hypothetical protein